MSDDDLTSGQREAQDRIHDLLAELADLIGPFDDGNAHEDLDFDELPEGAVFLSEWVLMSTWVDETGEAFTTRVHSPNLTRTHRVGLLHEGLYGFD